MATLNSDGLELSIVPLELLGDTGDRGITAVRFHIQLRRAKSDTTKTGDSPPTVLAETETVDEAPDGLFGILRDGVKGLGPSGHRSTDGHFSLGVCPLENDQTAHDTTFPWRVSIELPQKSDLIRLLASITEDPASSGAAAALVLDHSKAELEQFLDELASEIRHAPRAELFLRHPAQEALLGRLPSQHAE